MRRGARRATVAAAAAAAAVAVAGFAWSGSQPVSSSAAATTVATIDARGWTVYHHDPAGRGVTTGATAVTTTARAWTSPILDGSLYGEPLVSGGLVYVATEDNQVTALSATSGTVVWTSRLGPAVPASALPCGDIAPTVGITGTPVIDQSRGELFVVADELVGGRPSHRLVGLDLATGAIEMTEVVDPPGASPAALLQRTGLAIDGGRVVFGFGGNYGDCGTYRGWVVSADEAGGPPTDFAVDAAADESQGAIWMGGAAPVVDAQGNIWVSAGNGSVTSDSHPYDHSDSVLELSSALRLEQYFAPTDWPADNAADLDLSMAPALLGDGQVVIAGKARLAYLLDGGRLGGIGGQAATAGPLCRDDVDGGSATVGTTVYLPCLSGIVAVRAANGPPTLQVLWTSSTGGGPPVVAAGLVWTIGQDGTLSGLDPATGAVRQRASVGQPANHFPTPSVGDGVLLAASADRVVAFSATDSPTAPSTTGTATAPPSTPGSARTTVPSPGPAVTSGGGSGSGPVVAAAAALAAGLVALAVTAARWRRRHRGRRGPPDPGR